ncbi:hypothetical protein Pint_29690 [Pistacia integerrima]|uniref:Uncharacterized protein n=1 Tax=Pistacia integerrima TaxID=434235 RepID=A0ACC0WYC0_9ROSI|nr:hypothetical protein Pint_29690 [Pistacia integerrima]
MIVWVPHDPVSLLCWVQPNLLFSMTLLHEPGFLGHSEVCQYLIGKHSPPPNFHSVQCTHQSPVSTPLHLHSSFLRTFGSTQQSPFSSQSTVHTVSRLHSPSSDLHSPHSTPTKQGHACQQSPQQPTLTQQSPLSPLSHFLNHSCPRLKMVEENGYWVSCLEFLGTTHWVLGIGSHFIATTYWVLGFLPRVSGELESENG